MKTRGDYERAISVVREVIHRWDPYSLLAGGSPFEEFDSEIAAIVTRVPHIRSLADAVNTLSQVFSSAFEPELFRPEECSRPGAELYEALTAAGLMARQSRRRTCRCTSRRGMSRF